MHIFHCALENSCILLNTFTLFHMHLLLCNINAQLILLDIMYNNTQKVNMPNKSYATQFAYNVQ